ncbi:MAG: 50S ribosomal protein L21 [Firmicutes bacterium]|nr:50S ribosomal protein L21 [Bacillota bacterium]
MYAVIETGGKQYRVEPGQVIVVEKLPGEPGEALTFERLLMVRGEEGEAQVGSPYVGGAKVHGTILSQERGKKIVVFKYKPKSNYRRHQGHRQWQTRVRIDRIDLA